MQRIYVKVSAEQFRRQIWCNALCKTAGVGKHTLPNDLDLKISSVMTNLKVFGMVMGI